MYRITIPLALLSALSTTACRRENHRHEEAPKLLVTSPLRRDTELTKEYVGQIRAIQHIELRALEKGYVQGIYVDEGQALARGTMMFQILPLVYRAEVQKAKAEADLTEIEYNNTKLLAEKNVVSPNELALANAKVGKAKAEVALAKTHQSLTEIRAPFDGIMGRFQVRLGSLVDEGDLLTTLSDNRTMWVYFNVSEVEYLEYQSQPDERKITAVELRMANGALFDQPGKIETIEADFNHENGNVAFRAAFPNPGRLLRHGETGNVVMSIPMKNALLIPQKATFDVLDRKYVFVIDEKNVVQSRPVTIAAELPQLYVVQSGLDEHDRILLEGLRKVHDGTTIDVDYRAPGEVLDHLEVPAE